MVTSTEFVQGRTWRWGLGWSFDSSLKEKVYTRNVQFVLDIIIFTGRFFGDFKVFVYFLIHKQGGRLISANTQFYTLIR